MRSAPAAFLQRTTSFAHAPLIVSQATAVMYVCPVGALLGPQPKFPWQKGLYGRSRWTTGYSRISHLMYKLGLKGRTSQAIRSFGKKGAGRFTIHVTVASCAYWAGVYASCHDICTQVANE